MSVMIIFEGVLMPILKNHRILSMTVLRRQTKRATATVTP